MEYSQEQTSEHSPPMEVGTGDHELQKVLAGRNIQWWRGIHLRTNLICVLLIITSMTNGYDGWVFGI